MPEIWRWLQDSLFILSLINLAFTLVVLVTLTIGNSLIKRLADLPVPELDHWPSVSLIAPGRNEITAGLAVSRSDTIALPAYTGCRTVTASPLKSNAVTSDANGTPSSAATRGARSRPSTDAEKNAARAPVDLISVAAVAASDSAS